MKTNSNDTQDTQDQAPNYIINDNSYKEAIKNKKETIITSDNEFKEALEWEIERRTLFKVGLFVIVIMIFALFMCLITLYIKLTPAEIAKSWHIVLIFCASMTTLVITLMKAIGNENRVSQNQDISNATLAQFFSMIKSVTSKK